MLVSSTFSTLQTAFYKNPFLNLSDTMLRLGIGLSNSGDGLPSLPTGFAFLTDNNGAYLTDNDGNYLIAEE